MRDTVRNTRAFKNLSVSTQNFIGKTANIQSIQHSMAVIKTIGFEEWKRITPVSPTNLSIINELLENVKQPKTM